MRKLILAACCIGLLSACGHVFEEEHHSVTVIGEIVYTQESMGWSTPIHTVIKQSDGRIIRVYGIYGHRGDKITITADQYIPK